MNDYQNTDIIPEKIEGKLPVKPELKKSPMEKTLPVKEKQELLPYEGEKRTTLEKAIMELSSELENLSELREAIEQSFDNKSMRDDKFQTEITQYFNSLTKKFEEFNERITREIDYNRELELKIEKNEYQGQVYLLEKQLNEERASITKVLDDISSTVKNSLMQITDKCRELKSADTIIEDSITKFRSDSFAASENEYKALAVKCENALKSFTENSSKTLDTVKKTAVEFIKQCEKENKELIRKVPEVKPKINGTSWLVIIFGCLGIGSLIFSLFIKL